MAKHKIDKLFFDRLEDHESTPKESAWEQIESQLDQKQSKKIWFWVGVAASAALLITSSILIFQKTEEPTVELYSYAESSIDNPGLPTKVVYVPIYIHTVVKQPAQVIIKTETPAEADLKNLQNDIEPVILAKNEDIIKEQPEIIALEEVPVFTEEVTVAAIDLPTEEEPALSVDGSEQLQPVTIIYKQGEPAQESNFTKALNYMEDVRMGEKKLVNFEKLRENFRSKFRSEEETD